MTLKQKRLPLNVEFEYYYIVLFGWIHKTLNLFIDFQEFVNRCNYMSERHMCHGVTFLREKSSTKISIILNAENFDHTSGNVEMKLEFPFLDSISVEIGTTTHINLAALSQVRIQDFVVGQKVLYF